MKRLFHKTRSDRRRREMVQVTVTRGAVSDSVTIQRCLECRGKQVYMGEQGMSCQDCGATHVFDPILQRWVSERTEKKSE